MAQTDVAIAMPGKKAAASHCHQEQAQAPLARYQDILDGQVEHTRERRPTFKALEEQNRNRAVEILRWAAHIVSGPPKDEHKFDLNDASSDAPLLLYLCEKNKQLKANHQQSRGPGTLAKMLSEMRGFFASANFNSEEDVLQLSAIASRLPADVPKVMTSLSTLAKRALDEVCTLVLSRTIDRTEHRIRARESGETIPARTAQQDERSLLNAIQFGEYLQATQASPPSPPSLPSHLATLTALNALLT